MFAKPGDWFQIILIMIPSHPLSLDAGNLPLNAGDLLRMLRVMVFQNTYFADYLKFAASPSIILSEQNLSWGQCFSFGYSTSVTMAALTCCSLFPSAFYFYSVLNLWLWPIKTFRMIIIFNFVFWIFTLTFALTLTFCVFIILCMVCVVNTDIQWPGCEEA